MNRAMSTWCFPAEIGLTAMLSSMRKAGLDGVELTMMTDGPAYLSPSSTEPELAAVKELCKKSGLTPHALACNAFMHFPLTDNGERGQKAAEYARKLIHMASVLDIDTVLLLPGAVEEGISYQDAYDRAGTALVELGRYARPLGVQIAIENVWQKFLLSPLEFRHFIEGIRLPNIGMYFDVGNVINIGFPAHWIDILGSHIKRVHIKDYKAGSGDWYGFTHPFLGSVDWASVMDALRGVNYDGWLTTEIAPVECNHELGAMWAASILNQLVTM
jgi:hexulose-6-phosphate isomerase